MKKRILALILVLCLTVSLLPAVSAAEIASGTCGDNLNWVLTDDGTLTISGEGEMEDYDDWPSQAPWYAYSREITHVEIQDGVTCIGDYAFYRCYYLRSITIPDGVTSIGDWAFSDCDELTNIIIPDSVTNIGQGAFYWCLGLTSVNIPDNVTSIGSYTFYGCGSLPSISIPAGVTFLSKDAFYECYSMTAIYVDDNNPVYSSYDGIIYNKDRTTLYLYPRGKQGSVAYPDSVTSIDHMAFAWCIGLTRIKIPDSVTSIGDSAFYECSGLESVIIPDSVTSIGDSAFFSCSSLRSITIPDSVTSIGAAAFAGCSDMQSITLPSGLDTIDYGVFQQCSSLMSITIPVSVTRIGNSAFYGCSGLWEVYYGGSEFDWNQISIGAGNEDLTYAMIHYNTILDSSVPEGLSYEVVEDHVKITYYNGSAYELVIPAEIEGLPVTVIGYSVFHDCYTLSSITIPNSVTLIGSYAFYNCSNLERFTIPDSVTQIGSYAFELCTSLESIAIPEGITSIGASTFHGCTSLKSVSLPSSLTAIGDRAFEACTSLESITIPESVSSIGSSTFHGCTNLKSVSLPSRLTSIKDRTFEACTSLERITIHEGVTQIMDYAFSQCSEMTDVTLPVSVTFISLGAFYACSSLTDVYINGSKDEWDATIFMNDNDEFFNATFHYAKESEEHEHSFTNYISDGNATCTQDGTKTAKCDSCDETHTIADEGSRLGHDVANWHTVTEPTCTTEGMEQRECTRCDYSENRAIPVIAHSHVPTVIEPTCTEQGFTTHICACGHSFVDTYVDALGHDLTDWTVVEEPTADANGLAERRCLRCGHTEQQMIDTPFADVPAGSFYSDSVLWAIENGITTGTGDESFSPEDECNRAQVVTFLWRAAGSPDPTSTSHPFVDVEQGSFYEKAVLWAVENGITTGLDDTHFGSTTSCNRAQVVTFLYRAKGKPAFTSTDCPFSDVVAGAWYEAPILWAVENGITTGMGDGTFGVNTICNRAQVVTFLYRAYVN